MKAQCKKKMQFTVCLSVLQFYCGYFSATASIFLPPGDFLYDNVFDITETKSEVVSNFPDPMCNNCVVVYIVTYSTGAILDGVNQESWCAL